MKLISKILIKKNKKTLNTKSTKPRSKTPPNKTSKIPLRSKELRSICDKNLANNSSRKNPEEANHQLQAFDRKPKTKNSKAAIQTKSKIENEEKSSQHKRSHSNQTFSSDQIAFDSETEQILKEVSKTLYSKQPAMIQFENSLENFENNNSLRSINLVEQKTHKIHSIFGPIPEITTFLEKTRELKSIPNLSQINYTKELFSKVIISIQNIQVRRYLPKELNGLSNSISKRLKSLRQSRTFDLAVNYMQNEFDRFNNKILKISEDFDGAVYNSKIESLSKENEKLIEKVNFLQNQIKENLDNDLEIEKKELISQIKDLLDGINSQKEKNEEELSQLSEKFDKFNESRQKLLSSAVVVNQQIKKLEKAKFSVFEKNAKSVTIKGKVYNEAMIEDEIAQLLTNKENLLSGFDKIESHEKKFILGSKQQND